MIVAALVAGAAKAAADAAPDAYKGLKALIQKKFAGKPEAEMALAKYEEKPKVWEEPLKEALVELGADQNQEILKAAQAVLDKIKEQPDAQEIINQTVSHVKYAATSGSGDASISSINEYGTSEDK
ncbi:MAG: hypothetical protein HC899_40100 [Leptolyngbyaceae cyanobacterium SM1_4_3]|nr:hypothetical protein [Leptolyngbyaceae cyanobacterium SM1_4_3]